jgi:hypothetical protein
LAAHIPVTAAAVTAGGDFALVTTDGTLHWVHGGSDTVVGRIPEGVDTYALRISPAGTRIAAIGAERTVVVDRSAGSIREDFRADSASSTQDAGMAPVEDVAFSSESILYVLRGDGSLAKASEFTDPAVLSRLSGATPRPLRPEEKAYISSAAASVAPVGE